MTCSHAAAPSPARSQPSTAAPVSGQTIAPAAARAARLRTLERRQAALRDRPDRPLPLETPNSPATPASHPSTPAPANTNATASTAAATASSTARCTGSRSHRAVYTPPRVPTSNANKTKARHAAKPSAASNDDSRDHLHHPQHRAGIDVGADAGAAEASAVGRWRIGRGAEHRIREPGRGSGQLTTGGSQHADRIRLSRRQGQGSLACFAQARGVLRSARGHQHPHVRRPNQPDPRGGALRRPRHGRGHVRDGDPGCRRGNGP